MRFSIADGDNVIANAFCNQPATSILLICKLHSQNAEVNFFLKGRDVIIK